MVATLTDLGSTMATAAYFAREGYYAKDDPRQRRASFWHGASARALGLPKHVSPRAFERILAGHVPGTEVRLGRARDGEHEHRPGLDLTLSAPKSVSLEALLHGDRRVLGAHDRAVRATLDWIEAELLETRGYDPATGRRPRVAADGLVAAGFRHLTSRDRDPQLHTHCILANMTRNRAGSWRSVEPTAIRRSVRLIGARYRHELARELLGLGFRIEPTMIGGVPGFEIAGYPRAVLDAFSSRRREILAWLDEHGLPWSTALKQQAALITRRRKADTDIDTLRAQWRARAERLGLARDRRIAVPGRRRRAPGKAARLAGRPYLRRDAAAAPEPPGPGVREIVWRAVEHLAERSSVFRESEVRALALGHAPGRHPLAEIDAAVSALAADGHLVEARVRGGRAFVTGEALRAERAILARMRAGVGAAEALAPEPRVSERLAASELTAGQREAVRTVVLSRDRTVAVQGAAGTGKTTMLREALGLLGGRPAILLAPSAAAARVLAAETGARARTLQWFLTRYGELGDAGRTASARRGHAGSVLVLDESSMVSTAQMELLMRIAERLRIARLVLVGDRGQLRATGAGEPFRAIQEAGARTAEMDEILRQRDPGLRRAVDLLRGGRAGEAVRGLGEVREVPQEELGAEAARLWLALEPERRAQTAILAPTHFVRARINRAVREALGKEGVLHGREIEIERYVNRHLTAAQRADVRNHEPGDVVVFHSRVPPLRVDAGDACRIARTEGEFAYLDHPSGRTVRIRPGDGWVRYRFGLYETARIRLRAGDRIRWTRNDRGRGLVNGGEAAVTGIDSRRVRFDLEDGKTLSLRRDDPQLCHLDHAWSSTVHAAQGSTHDAAIGVLDAGHGRLAGQAALYVEASRARDRFVLVTDNRELLAEALEDNDGARLSALEAAGGDDGTTPAADPAAAMLRGLRDDWNALVARGGAEGAGPGGMEEHARIAGAVAALRADADLPADLRGFAAEVRRRDAEHVARRREALAFVQKADMHGRARPLLAWAAEACGRPVSEMPEHAAWLAEGEALAETGRRLQETASGSAVSAGTVVEGLRKRIVAGLRRLARSLGLDEAERFREAALRHEARARHAGADPRLAPGADGLAERARALRERDLPARVRETVEAWSAVPAAPAAPAPSPEHPGHVEAGRRIEAFLRACGACLAKDTPPSAPSDPDARIGSAAALRREGLRMLGEGAGAALDDPVRIRLSRAPAERARVREAVDALGEHVRRLRAGAFTELRRSVEGQGRDAGADPADLAAWEALRERAAALRGEPGLAPEVERAVARVLAHDARVEAETAPAETLLAAAAAHLERRAAPEASAPEGSAPEASWGERAEALREIARRLLGDAPANAATVRAAERLAAMPRLRGRVREVLGRLEAIETADRAAEFRALAASVEARARRQGDLALHAAGYARATEMAAALVGREAVPDEARRAADAWLARDRGWRAELASVRNLAAAHGGTAEPDRLREGAALPAVSAAIRREAASLRASPRAPERTVAWTGEAPLVAGDRIAWRARGAVVHAVVVFPGEAGGVRGDDVLRLRMTGPGDRAAGTDEPAVEIAARALVEAGCGRALWADEGLRELDVARQYSVPAPSCRLPCPEPVEGDRIAWTEAAGRDGAVRTIEAVVTARDPGVDRLELRTIRASGRGAPAPGSAVVRTAAAVAARGCYRAPWADEERRRQILEPPPPAPAAPEPGETPDPDVALDLDLGPRL